MGVDKWEWIVKRRIRVVYVGTHPVLLKINISFSFLIDEIEGKVLETI